TGDIAANDGLMPSSSSKRPSALDTLGAGGSTLTRGALTTGTSMRGLGAVGADESRNSRITFGVGAGGGSGRRGAALGIGADIAASTGFGAPGPSGSSITAM